MHDLDSVIGYPEHLDHPRNALRHLDAKKYGAHHLDIIIGYPVHLDHASVAP